MHRLVMLMIVVATTFEFLAKGDNWGRWSVLPNQAKYLGDLFGLVALVFVVAVGARTRFQYVRPAYWLVFTALIFGIAAGVVVNNVAPGPIFAGIRTYMRAMPWFFVGAVFLFSDIQIRRQLQLLLVVALIQIPLAIEQRNRTMFKNIDSTEATNFSGDFTTGTLIDPAVLSIFLIGGICVLVALHVRNRLRWPLFAVLFLLLLLPTLINETKATIVLLPVAIIMTYLAAAEPGRRLRALVIASGLVLVSSAIFVPVYDSFRRESQPGIMEFLTDTEVSRQYLWKQTDVGDTVDGKAGRVDSIVVPLRRLALDPVNLVFGYGIGNASDSALGRGFVGKHFETFQAFMHTAFARITLELGMLGLTFVLLLMCLILQDAMVVSRRSQDLRGALAAALAGITTITALSITYKDLTGQMSVSFLFWYLAGLIAGHRMRAAVEARHSASSSEMHTKNGQYGFTSQLGTSVSNRVRG